MRTSIIFSLIISVLSTNYLIACSCRIVMEELTYEEYFLYDNITLVKVVNKGKIHYLPDTIISSRGILWYKIEPLKSFKGEIRSDTIWSPPSCQRELVDGGTYIYYEFGSSNHQLVGLCDRTKSETDGNYGNFDQELEFLNLMEQKPFGKIHPTYSTGQVIGKGSFENEEFEGYWEFYYPDGELKAKGLFVKGKKDGKWWEREYEGWRNSKEDYGVRTTKTGMYKMGEKVGEWEYRVKSPEDGDEFPYFRNY